MFWWLTGVLVALAIIVLYPITKTIPKRKRRLGWESMSFAMRPGVQVHWTEKLTRKQREDLIWEAMGSGDLDIMLRALEIPGYTPERHFILSSIVAVTYGAREDDRQLRELCEQIAWKHIEEFPELLKALKARKPPTGRKEPGLPPVRTFQYLAAILSERGEYDKAIEVCEKAIAFGVSDGTKSGYEGRIERLEKARQRVREPRTLVAAHS